MKLWSDEGKGDVYKRQCLTCHTEGKSPHFDEARYWPAVEH